MGRLGYLTSTLWRQTGGMSLLIYGILPKLKRVVISFEIVHLLTGSSVMKSLSFGDSSPLDYYNDCLKNTQYIDSKLFVNNFFSDLINSFINRDEF